MFFFTLSVICTCAMHGLFLLVLSLNQLYCFYSYIVINCNQLYCYLIRIFLIQRNSTNEITLLTIEHCYIYYIHLYVILHVFVGRGLLSFQHSVCSPFQTLLLICWVTLAERLPTEVAHHWRPNY